MTTHQPLSPEEFNAQLVAALPLVRWHLRRRGFPDDRLDDLVNEAACRALRYRENYDPARGKLGTWLCCIALRHSAQTMSMERKLAMLLGKAAASHACRRPGPSEELERREEQERVVALLATLPDDAAVALRLVTTGPYAGATLCLGWSEGTIKSVVSRARSRIRENRPAAPRQRRQRVGRADHRSPAWWRALAAWEVSLSLPNPTESPEPVQAPPPPSPPPPEIAPAPAKPKPHDDLFVYLRACAEAGRILPRPDAGHEGRRLAS